MKYPNFQRHYLWKVRNQSKCLNRDFPNEKLGVADRFLLNQIIKEEIKFIRKYKEGNKIFSYLNQVRIIKRARDYGFKPRKMVTNF